MPKSRYVGRHRKLRASRYIRSFDALKRGDRVVIYARMSSRTSKGSTRKQVAALRKALKAIGVKAVAVVEIQCPGYDAPDRSDDHWATSLRKAARLAVKHQAMIVATEVNRFLRSPRIGDQWDVEPARLDYRRLEKLTRSVPLVSLLDPDAPREVAHRTQIARGQNGKQGGRPPKPAPRRAAFYRDRADEATIATVFRMRADGRSIGEVAKALGRSRSTVQGWVQKAEAP